MWPLLPEGSLDEFVKVAAITAVLTAVVVLVHYEGLKLLALHVAEIWCYGIGYYWMEQQPDMGFVHGPHGIGSLFDAIYFSATIYTTLGLGDLSPVGPIRLLTGMESVTGLLLITWSASFTYLEMSRVWQPDGE